MVREPGDGAGVLRIMTNFAGFRVLVVEDELLIALALEDILLSLDCEVFGPVSQVDEALALVRTTSFDGALLDVNVRGQLVYPVAEELLARDIPIVFCSGYADTAIMPPRFRSLPQVAKPYDDRMLVRVIEKTFLPPRAAPETAGRAER